MADETKTEENKTQIEAAMTSLKDASNEIDESIQKLSETTLEPYQQKLASASTTTPNPEATSTANQNIQKAPQQSTGSMDNKEREQEEVDLTNLIINYLPPTMSEGTLATLFSPYGLLERCKIVVDLQTLRSRGYGFVKYDNPISAERALNALNGYELNGKKLKVAFARQQCKAITNSNLYLTNIPPHFTDSNLVKLFNDFGKIIECRVLMDQNGQSRGVGFVRMDTHHNAIQALQAMDQYVIDDKHPPLLVKLAQRRVPRRFWQDGQQNGQRRNGQQNNHQNKYNNANKQGMGGQKNMGRNKNNGKNSPNRKYYPNQNRSQNSMPSSMNNMGGPQNAKRGYYRPRNQGYKQGQNANKGQYGQQQQRRGGGPPYFPQAPMYGDAPYGMPSYGQAPQGPYAANLHPQMTASNVMANNAPPNVSNQGPKRNKSLGDWQ